MYLSVIVAELNKGGANDIRIILVDPPFLHLLNELGEFTSDVDVNPLVIVLVELTHATSISFLGAVRLRRCSARSVSWPRTLLLVKCQVQGAERSLELNILRVL